MCQNIVVTMNLLNFIISVILITASGALAPGPLFFVTLSYGAKYGAKCGLMFSIAHTLIEFSVVILFTFGIVTIAATPLVKLIIGMVGGISLLIFGAKQIQNTLSPKIKITFQEVKTQNLFLLGLALTGLNPFFIIWWLTVGSKLILLSLEFAALGGVIIMYICHVWIDYVWYILVAHFAKIGMNMIGSKGYRVTMAFLGIILIYFGLAFITNSLSL